MTTKTSKRKDYTQLAFAVVQQATGEVEPAPELTGKSPIAQGGRKAARPGREAYAGRAVRGRQESR